MNRYRVRAYSRLEYDYGYVGTFRHYYQDLQIKRWWGWVTLDTEEVPSWVRCYNPIGGASGWRSKFSDRFHWGRNGLCTPSSG